MEFWQVLLVVAAAGAIGGVVAALLSEDRGFALPTKVTEATGTIIRPGFVGLIMIGAAAAALSWSLYGPFADKPVIGGPQTEVPEAGNFGITPAALAGAVLVGTSGSKWLASQVDKALLKQAATAAAQGDPDGAKANEIGGAAPTEALRIARTL